MLHKFLKISLTLGLSASISACNGESGGTTTTPALMLASQGSIAGSVGDVTAAQIQAAAAGPVDWSGQSGPFPSTISGGDGFQANPNNDASFGTLINAVRTASGVAPVAYNAQLDAAAQAHSADMVANGYFSHTGLNGSTMASRAAAAGYTGTATGENIARGQTNENLVINGWISSPGHQSNNVNPISDEFGLGRAGTGSNTTWTLMFGAK